MRYPHLPATLLAVALLAACDVAPSPTDSRIEVRSASVEEDSMHLIVAVDDQEREVLIADLDGARAVAVVSHTADEPLATLVSEANPECVTEDAVACELTDAAFDGTLEDLAAQVDDVEFRLRSVFTCEAIVTDWGTMCLDCGDFVIVDCF
jgi:hypothetical protein